MIDINKVVPTKDLVVVKLLNLNQIQDDLLLQDQSSETNITVRHGEVISMGPNATLPEHCNGLKIGDHAAFTEFAGHYIASSDSQNLYKIIRGYDIIGITMKSNDDTIDVDSLTPTGNRFLVEIEDLTQTDDGLVINTSDPRIAELEYGKISRVSNLESKLNLTVGQLVAFPIYAGTTIRHYESEDKKALKVIVEEDILFTV